MSGNISENKILVIIGGPTCSGKTSLAIALATIFQTEIVSADSRQFYSEMNIGTAKPTTEELKKAKHYFIGSESVQNHLNAANYAVAAFKLLQQLFTDHDIVILAGGSGLYIDALITGIDDLPPANEEIRNLLNSKLKSEGLTGLQEMLKEKDPQSFGKIDIRNPRRVIRALEVTLATGKKYSSLIGKKPPTFPWKWMMTGIALNRETLYNRINNRTAEMIRSGLKEEVAGLLPYRHHRALQTVGYKEMFEHLDGNSSLEETQQKIAQNTRNYAKRQMTWFKKYPGMIWIQPDEFQRLTDRIRKELRKS